MNDKQRVFEMSGATGVGLFGLVVIYKVGKLMGKRTARKQLKETAKLFKS